MLGLLMFRASMALDANHHDALRHELWVTLTALAGVGNLSLTLVDGTPKSVVVQGRFDLSPLASPDALQAVAAVPIGIHQVVSMGDRHGEVLSLSIDWAS